MIEIRNANTAGGGSDFALDDIYFGGAVFSNPVPALGAVLLCALGSACFAEFRRRT